MPFPQEIKTILTALTDASFQAYAVGGCVRDLLLEHKPKDWDITTNATPDKIQKLFPESFYENTFGTVTVKTGSEDPTLAQVQITPYRIEAVYTDKRHPDQVRFAAELKDDLGRRDFTVNAMAMDTDSQIIDLYDGQSDLKEKLIRAVGSAQERFNEDALRILRAIRFATTLGFIIEPGTTTAIKDNHHLLRVISKERIRDELVKIVESPHAYEGMLLLLKAGILEHVVPELLTGVDMEQNLHHIYTVWEHNIRSLKYTADKDYPLAVRLAALLHDVGKPASRRGEGRNCTFYGHEVIGARMTAKIMERLKFPRELSEKVIRLVRYHLFYYYPNEVTESSVRRLLANVGPENVEDLLKVREADRIGSGTPKAIPYKLRHLKYVIDKVSHDPISVKMLKVNGEDVMKMLGIAPGPKIGLLLNSLLAEVLDEPSRNTREHLEQHLYELDKKSPDELRTALVRIEREIEAKEQERMRKYSV